MPILERTPPQKRQQNGEEFGMDSSPSRARHDRSIEKQRLNGVTNGHDDFIFPSLDAMAAPMRERNAAMTMSKSWTPVLNGSVNGSGRKEFGSVGSTGGRRMGGLNGKNAPIKVATAGSMYPSIGESSIRSISRSPHKERENVSVSPHNRAQNVRQADPSRTHDIPASTSRSQLQTAGTDRDERPIKGMGPRIDNEDVDDRRAFEEQMERALASGANPFQDKKRDQMRGESRVNNDTIKEQRRDSVNGRRGSSRQSTPRDERLSVGRDTRDQEPPYKAQHQAEGIASVATNHDQSPVENSPQPDSSPIPSPPKPRSSMAQAQLVQLAQQDEIIAQLREDLMNRQNSIEEERQAAKEARKSLTRMERVTQQQEERIKGLEVQLKKAADRPREQPLSDITSCALTWELMRVKCRNDWNKVEEVHMRDIEAVIYKNEVTYMEARKVEAELDFQWQQMKMDEMSMALKRSQKQMQSMWEDVTATERSRDELIKACDEIETRASEIEAERDAERDQRQSVESESDRLKKEMKQLRKKLEEEQETLRKRERELVALKSSQQSPSKKVAPIEQRAPSSPAKKQATTVKPTATSSRARTKEADPPRRSPTKQAMDKARAAVVNGVKRKPSTKVVEEYNQDEIDDQSASFDAVILSPRPAKASTTTAIKKGSSKRPMADQSVEDKIEQEEDEDVYEEPVKKAPKVANKKSSLLERGKAASSGKKSSTVRSREVTSDPVTESPDIEKTPVMPVKQKMVKAQPKKLNNAIDESFNIDATPIIQTKVKKAPQQQRQSGASNEDEEIENLTPVVPSKRTISKDESKTLSKTARGPVTTEVKKKKRRLLKQTTNVANGFLVSNGDGDGDLDPVLNLPLELSPLKDDARVVTSSSSNILGRGIKGSNGTGSLTAAASRLFGR